MESPSEDTLLKLLQDSQVADPVWNDLKLPNKTIELLADTRSGRNYPILKWVEFGAILLGVLFKALLIGLLVKSRLTKQHPSGTFLGAISFNNILILGFQYGFYWIYLATTETVYCSRLLSDNFSCKIVNFMWTFSNYNAYLLMTGFSVHMLLQQQLQENDDSTAGKRGCCSLPRSPCWKGIATRMCSQSGTRIYLIAASISLVVLCLPIFWTYSIGHGGVCNIDWRIWSVLLSNLSSIWWIVFFITFPVIAPLIICGSGARLFTRSRNVSSTGEESQENIDQFPCLTRLSLVTCTISWNIGILLHSPQFVLLGNIVEVFPCINCISLLCWSIFCCILVPGIFLEMKRCCASISTAVRRLCCSKRQEERNEEELASQTL